MTQYKYDDILPIYNTYSKMADDKLHETLDAIYIVEELINDLTMLLSKKEKKTPKDVGDISYYVEELKDIDVEKTILTKYGIETFINKKIKPTKDVNVNIEYVYTKTKPESSSSHEPQPKFLHESQPESSYEPQPESSYEP